MVYLVARRETAVGDFKFAKDKVQKLFGDVPRGVVNPVFTSGGKLDAKAVIGAFPLLDKTERLPNPKKPAKTFQIPKE